MIESIENLKIINYNNVILDVNSFCVCEKDNPYGHVKEFNKLDMDTKVEAHRVISRKSLELYVKGKMYGSSTDINGNSYDFEIFSDTTYRIINIDKYDIDLEEIANEKYIKKNS